MKRTLLVICLIMASLLPVQLTVAMEKGKERKAKKEKVEKEQSRLAFLARYFNFLSFNGKIAGIYFQDAAPVASDSDSDSFRFLRIRFRFCSFKIGRKHYARETNY